MHATLSSVLSFASGRIGPDATDFFAAPTLRALGAIDNSRSLSRPEARRTSHPTSTQVVYSNVPQVELQGCWFACCPILSSNTAYAAIRGVLFRCNTPLLCTKRDHRSNLTQEICYSLSRPPHFCFKIHRVRDALPAARNFFTPIRICGSPL